ncbi:SLC13 family permease [Aeoliella mucimassa]|uniref:Potassium transporter peripheral membrane component n=1 Tax=Aeoliella mucimassa TaxID=2527972 RepID=A0A518AUA1_9BACT|nr:SLC13 family permease [Aeoliella mucimassa]QDU58286.1 potassium transporter peripheral membrane component [Aeoliella mucimassa]
MLALIDVVPLIAAAGGLTIDGVIALLVIALVFCGLVWLRGVPIDLLFLAGLVLVTLSGVITPRQATEGFASPAVLFIAALFATSAGLRATGALDWIGTAILGTAKTERAALVRLSLTVVPVSAFVLNTPLVAMFMPVLLDWCRQRKVSPSRVLIPLSYLTIVGGVCTLIGTSTTLVVNAELAKLQKWIVETGRPAELVEELEFFDITWVGIPLAIIGVVYLLTIGPKLLPKRSEIIDELGERRREYLVEMLVQNDCPLIGKSVEQAGLRNLPGLFLIEIDRDEELIAPVTPNDMIHAGDRMVFTGVVQTIADLERIPGLVPAADLTYEFQPAQRTQRRLTEAVLSRTSPLIGRSVREANFRQRYNAAIVAVHRNGERLTNKIGSIRLEPGDTLLLQTKADFAEAYRNSRDFYLVSAIGGSSARRHDRAIVAMALFGLMIVWLTVAGLWGDLLPFGNLFAGKPQPIIGLAIVLLMIGTRAMSTSEARSAIDLQVIITIAAAIGLGQALKTSGAAQYIADHLVSVTTASGISASLQPYVLLALIYLVTALFTEMISNVAVAAMMIPIAVGVALAGPDGGYSTRPFIMAVALAASLSFATPIGYQTNLMVMGPGGYRPVDYLRIGLPLTLILMVASVVIVPIAWPF